MSREAVPLSAADVQRYDLRDEDVITICSYCLRACCWAGIEYCSGAKIADTMDVTVARAKELAREHPSYWIALRKAEGYR
jgi:hypothetical protein